MSDVALDYIRISKEIDQILSDAASKLNVRSFQPANYIEPRCCNCRHWVLGTESGQEGLGQCPFIKEGNKFVWTYPSEFCRLIDSHFALRQTFKVWDIRLMVSGLLNPGLANPEPVPSEQIKV